MTNINDWLRANPVNAEPEDEEERPSLARTVLDAPDLSPDDVAAQRRVAQEAGLPPTLGADPMAARAADARRLSDLHTSSPRLAAWMAQPDNYAVARDDADNLSIFERIARAGVDANPAISAGRALAIDIYRWGQGGFDMSGLAPPADYAQRFQDRFQAGTVVGRPGGYAGGVFDAVGGFIGDLPLHRQGAMDTEQSALGIALARAENGHGPAFTDEQRARLDALSTREGADDWGPPIIGPVLRTLPQIEGQFGAAFGAGGRGFGTVMDAAGGGTVERTALLPLAGVVSVGHGLGGYLEYTYEQEAGQAYLQMRQADIQPDIAWSHAQQYGGMAVALEFAGDILGAKLSGLTRLAGRTFGVGLRELETAPIRRAGVAVLQTGLLEEGPTEALQQLAQTVHQNLAEQERDTGHSELLAALQLSPDDIQQILTSYSIGAQAGSGMAVLPSSVNMALDMRANRQAVKAANQFEAQTNAAQNSRLSVRQLGSTLESAIGAMDESSVYIDADKFVEHFQSAAYDVAADLGVSEQTLSTALSSHGQIEIPTARFAARVLSNAKHASLADHTRIAPDADTPAEARSAAEAVKAHVERLVEETKAVQNDNDLGLAIETRMRALFQQAEQEGGPRAEVGRRYAQLAAALPRAMVARARAVDGAFADRLEKQFRQFFDERFDIAGPGRDGGFEGAAQLDQRGTGPDAGPVREDRWDPPEGVRISERQRKIAEAAVNGASNEWIAEEWDTGRQTVAVELSKIKKKLGGNAPWEAGPQSMGRPAEVPIERIAQVRDQLRANGQERGINATLGQRFNMTPAAVKQRLWHYDKRRQAEELAAIAAPEPETAAAMRRQWVETQTVRNTIPGGEPGDYHYGFALSNGRQFYVGIADDGNGAANIDWSFLERLKDADPENPTTLYGDGEETIKASEWREIRIAIRAIFEADMAAHERPAYKFTPQRESNRRSNMNMIAEMGDELGYDLLDEQGEVYLIRPDAQIAKNGRIQPQEGWAPNFEEPQEYGSQEDADHAQSQFYANVEAVEVSADGPNLSEIARATREERRKAETDRANAEAETGGASRGAGGELNQNQTRGSIRYDAFKPGEFGATMIRMGKSSDLSTFLHEFGHLGHLVLESIATDEAAPAEFKSMWENTLQWWGVSQEEWAGFSNEQKTPYFEQWARTFEAYLMEGKAPSFSLREAFAAFKAWLTQIYRSVLRLDANLNPQIRDVFDRLLATNQEIAEARAAMGSDFTLAREAFKTDEEFQQYTAAIAAARDAQDAELRARVMDKFVRKEKRWWRSERERVRTTAEIEVDSDPARRALEWIAFNEWRALPVEQNEDGVELPANAELAMPEGLPEMRLDMSSLDDADRAGLPEGLAPLATAEDAQAALDSAMALKRQGRARQPQRLWAFIKAAGGIKDEGGEVTQALGSARSRPGLINNTSGLSADELALKAWEAGYFGAVPRQTLNQFGGWRAATANMDTLQLAKDLERAGSDRGYIWQHSGWARGLDGEWRFEIPAEDLRVIRPLNQVARRKTAITVGEVIDWPSLFAAYPHLENIEIEFTSDKTEGGSYWHRDGGNAIIFITRGHNNAALLSVLRHELQHAIQRFEGFAEGYSPDSVTRGSARWKKAVQVRLSHSEQWRKHKRGTAEPTPDDIREAEAGAAFAVYANEMGEIEARDVQNRARSQWSGRRGDYRSWPMSPEERAAVPPNDVFDMHRDPELTWRAPRSRPDSVPRQTLNQGDGPDAGSGGAGPAAGMQRGYHGSTNNFDRFDPTRVGRGQGDNAQGWGVNITEGRAAAQRYAGRLGRQAGEGVLYEVDFPQGPLLDESLPLNEQPAEVQALADQLNIRSVPALVRELASPSRFSSQRAASEAFRAAGVRGLRYRLTKDSNVAGFLIFDPADATIVSRNGQRVARNAPDGGASGAGNVVREFATGARQNAWLNVGDYSVYLQKGMRDIGGQRSVPTLEIASVKRTDESGGLRNLPEGQRGERGNFAGLMDEIERIANETGFDAVYVENIYNDFLPGVLNRRGYWGDRAAEGMGPPSMYRLAPSRVRQDAGPTGLLRELSTTPQEALSIAQRARAEAHPNFTPRERQIREALVSYDIKAARLGEAPVYDWQRAFRLEPLKGDPAPDAPNASNDGGGSFENFQSEAPLIYHGSAKPLNGIRPVLFATPDQPTAAFFARLDRKETRGMRRVTPLRPKFDNPLEVQANGSLITAMGTDRELWRLVEQAQENGNDAIIVHNVVDGPAMDTRSVYAEPIDVYIILDPKKVEKLPADYVDASPMVRGLLRMFGSLQLFQDDTAIETVRARVANAPADVPRNDIPMDQIRVAYPKADAARVSARLADQDGELTTSLGAKLQVRAGQDMVVGEAQGDARPVRKDIFDQTYQQVSVGEWVALPKDAIAPPGLQVRMSVGGGETMVRAPELGAEPQRSNFSDQAAFDKAKRAYTDAKRAADFVADLRNQWVKRSDVPVGFVTLTAPQTINTLEGPVPAEAGDVVLIGAIGEMWPIRAEKFAQRYDVAAVAPQFGSEAASDAAAAFDTQGRRPTPRELLDALIDDIKNVRQVFSSKDEAAVAAYQNRSDAMRWFEARGIDLSGTKEEIRSQIVDALNREAEQEAGGWAADDIAPWFGFSSGDELLQALKGLKPRAVAIEENIDARLEAQYGDPLKDGTVAEAAALAGHIEAQAKRIEIELAAIQRATGGKATPVGRAARAYAERQVQSMTVKQIRNYDAFLAGERRAARAAMEATAKKDFATAALMKQRQLISFHLYRLARDASEEMDVAQRYFQKFDRDTIRAKIHAPLLDQIDQALEGIDLRASPRISNRKRQSFTKWFEQMQADGLEHMVVADADFLEAVRNRPFNTLTLEEARAIRDAVRNFEHIGKRWREVLAARDNRLLEEAVSEMTASMEKVKPFQIADENDHSPGVIESIDRKRQALHAQLSRVEFIARAMDGDKDNGPVWNGLFRPLTEARDREEMRQEAAQTAIEQLFSVYSAAERADMWVKRKFYPQVPNRTGTRMGRNFTKQEILAIALNTGNEYNLGALLEGERKNSGMTETQLRALLDAAMDERDWRFVQSAWDYVESFWPEIEALYVKSAGVAPGKVQATPFTNRYGEFRGGYWHLEYDYGRDQRARDEMDFGAVQEAFGGFRTRTQTPNGFSKARQGSGGRPVRLDLAILTEHVNEVIHDLEFRLPVLNVWRVIKNESFRNAFVRAAGQEMYDTLKPWLQYTATERMPPERGFSGIIKLLRRNTPIALMGYAVSTIAQQPAGLMGTFHRVGAGRVMGKAMQLLAQPWTWGEHARFINARSPMMRNRTRISQREIREMVQEINSDAHVDAVKLLASGTVRQKQQALGYINRVMQRYALFPLAFLDKWVSSAAWKAAYDRALGGHVDGVNPQNEADVISYADQIIRTTFGSGRPEDMSPIMRSSELGKLITPAFSYFNTQYNQLYNEQAPGMMRGTISPLEFATFMTFTIVMQALVSQWMAGRWDPGDGEDEDDRNLRLMSEVALAPTAGVPLVRDMARGAVRTATTGERFTMSTVPAFGALGSTASGVGGSINDLAEDGEISRQSARDLTMAAGYWFGLPSRQIWTTGSYASDVASGEEDLPWNSPEPTDAWSEALLRDSR